MTNKLSEETKKLIKKLDTKSLEQFVDELHERIDKNHKLLMAYEDEIDNRGVKYKCLLLMPDGTAKFYLLPGYTTLRAILNPKYDEGVGGRMEEDAIFSQPIPYFHFRYKETIDDIYIYG